MKNIFFVRHAKSDWSNKILSDHDRPLNARGERDAKKMSEVFTSLGFDLDILLSSSAVRTQFTAQYFLETAGIDISKLKIEPSIYESSAENIFAIIEKIDKKHENVMIFGHNPTFTTIANYFSDTFIQNIPTCCIFQVESTAKDWSDFNADNSKIANLYFPKQYFSDAND